MTNDSLIEKLEALKPKSKSGTSFEMDTEWLAIDNCIGVVKDHFASEISVVDDNYMTVVFDRSVVNFDKNPMHIKSKFGNVVAISRGDALAKLDEATREPVMRVDGSTRKDDLRGEKPEESGAIAPATSTEQPVEITITRGEANAIIRKLGFLFRDYPDDKETKKLGAELKARVEAL